MGAVFCQLAGVRGRPSRRTDYRRHGLHSEARLGSGVLARTHAHMHTRSWCFKLPSAPLLQPLLCAFKHLSSDSTCCLTSLAGCCLLCLSELPEIIGGFLWWGLEPGLRIQGCGGGCQQSFPGPDHFHSDARGCTWTPPLPGGIR